MNRQGFHLDLRLRAALVVALVSALTMGTIGEAAAAKPWLHVNPKTATFGNVEVGQAGYITVYFTNKNKLSLQMWDDGFLGGSSTDFIAVFGTGPNDCTNWLEPGGTCAVQFQYWPGEAGLDGAAFFTSWTDGFTSIDVDIGLSGTGVSP